MTPPTERDLLLAALRFQGDLDSPVLRPGQGLQAAPAPLPEVAGLLGSIETSAEGAWYVGSLYFLPVPVAESDNVIRQANAALRALGWRDAEMTPHAFRPSGFQASNRPDFPEHEATAPDPCCMVLLNDAGKVAACWDTRHDEQGRVDLCLNLQPHAYGHWARQHISPLPTLPPLKAPDGWTLEVIGGGGNGHARASTASSLALLRGVGTQNDLYARLAEPLDNLGWTEQSVASSEALTISRWLTPEDDVALLTLMRREPGLWQAGLEVTRLHGASEDGSGESWFSF
ncbi:hypothetical protein [Deinococcus sp.]|uniref:hypothetical protein n=1 Tax=Deinococcus sp. TaxID=47478 RepID=UPI0025C0B788|nr:hypothetical protein [Deinococcus sp.]